MNDLRDSLQEVEHSVRSKVVGAPVTYPPSNVRVAEVIEASGRLISRKIVEEDGELGDVCDLGGALLFSKL